MSSTDVDGDSLKYVVTIYEAIPPSTCTSTVVETGDQTVSGAGWDNGITAYASGTNATYTIQTSLLRSDFYCWKAQAIDPGGSNTLSSVSSASFFSFNQTPGTTQLASPSSGATSISTTPQFQIRAGDNEADYLEYRIYLYQSDCSTAVSGSPFAEISSQTGWSGQDANAGTAYQSANLVNSSTMAFYGYQATLANNTTYCWKADAIDPGGSNLYGPASATQTFTTAAGGTTEQVNIGGGVNITGGTNIY
jgi:hypothetical protein